MARQRRGEGFASESNGPRDSLPRGPFLETGSKKPGGKTRLLAVESSASGASARCGGSSATDRAPSRRRKPSSRQGPGLSSNAPPTLKTVRSLARLAATSQSSERWRKQSKPNRKGLIQANRREAESAEVRRAFLSNSLCVSLCSLPLCGSISWRTLASLATWRFNSSVVRFRLVLFPTRSPGCCRPVLRSPQSPRRA